MEKPEQMNEQQNTEAKQQLKKSELLAEQKELFETSEVLIKEMQEREYPIDMKSKKIFDSLLKFLEKDAPWGHTTATGLIMLYHNLREQKPITMTQDWDGVINLRSANVTILWSMVTKMTGNGFYEAKSFVELMSVCGESLSKAVQQSHGDNSKLRETHARLSSIDDQLSSGAFVNDIESDDSSITSPLSIAEEVDPVVVD
jgi:hypothetical protein